MNREMVESIARAMAQENGTDFEEEMAIARSVARIEAEMIADERKARKIALNMKGYVPITEDSFRGY